MRARPMTIPSATGTAPPGQAGAGAAGDERDAALVADAHRRLHLLRRPRQHDRLRRRPVAREPVALVGAHLRRLGDHRVGAERALEFGDEAHPVRLLTSWRITICSSPPAR